MKLRLTLPNLDVKLSTIDVIILLLFMISCLDLRMFRLVVFAIILLINILNIFIYDIILIHAFLDLSINELSKKIESDFEYPSTTLA